jgi:hypothetical protein
LVDTTRRHFDPSTDRHVPPKAWLAEQPAGRFEFTFTPTHGSWLNLVEGFFSKLARSVLRHIRVASKHEAQRANHGRHQRRQSASGHPHMVPQAR